MSIEKKKILLIDDEEVILFGFKQVLTEPGVAVDTAISVREATALLEKHSYAAAIIDLRLSNSTVMEGLELIPYVRKNQKNCRIIAFSAYAEESIIHKTLESGADLFMEKPVDPEMIKKTLGFMGIY
jgi:DNA-binding response OmpR family regulator